MSISNEQEPYSAKPFGFWELPQNFNQRSDPGSGSFVCPIARRVVCAVHSRPVAPLPVNDSHGDPAEVW